MIFFTSDTHFSHFNIACTSSNWSSNKNRGFESVEDHDNFLLERINSKIRSNDTLYHLGDFSICSNSKTIDLRRRIKCKNIILCRGNHDEAIIRRRYLRDLFSEVCDYKTIRYEKQFIVLCHYSMRVWEKSHRGSWMLFGHSHGNLEDIGGKTMDVGVDCNNYLPWSFDEIKEFMSKREFKAVDHHV